eukprot:CAMPEP_0183785434 /NCGR_PEP_ID=MMETSP0739-20130205/66499_1 /TAXON_ID=385413 /ORGANISM="Thalassiosira miniscula, Strain CCMP1093" /LENGTH=629 /DNA_ID=CAMNT_0026029437 /DNA_START=226 /DNA_END=2116 /DNA_ORIENTATION=-
MSSRMRRRGCGTMIATSSHCCNNVATILRKSIIATLSLLALCPMAIHSLAFDTQSLSARSSCSFTSSSSTNTPFIFNNNNNNNCQGPPSPASSSSSSTLQMKVSSTSSKRTRSSKSSHLIERNNLRLRSAGKPGSKHFMDPNKLFIGNLPYSASESHVIELFAKEWNIPPEAVTDRIESIKIIRDWKTNQSKGYGFVQFYEPMMATSAMESVNKGANWNGKNRGAWKIMGRKIRLDQGRENNCQGPPSPASSSSSSNLQMKVSSTSSKRTRSSKSSHLIEQNNLRLRSAGKPGSKHFMDPNKLFIGNLPYAASESDVIDLFAKEWNIPPEAVTDRIESIKIIRDWKTNQSKGYGFVQFYEPMMATSAMESVNKGANWNGKNRGAWKIMGRKIRLDQGQRKPDDEEDAEEKLKKKKQKQKKEQEQSKMGMQKEDLDEEGLLIHSVLEGVEGDSSSGGASSVRGSGDASTSAAAEEEEDYDDDLGMSEDDMITFMEKGGLRGVMPLTEETAGFLGIEGLYEDDEGFDEVDESYFEEYYNLNGYSDGDFDDASLDNMNEDGAEGNGEDGEDDDDDEIAYDGVFEEMYNPNEYESLSEEEEDAIQKMNREQRRAAEKKRKKRKLPFKGFGSRD